MFQDLRSEFRALIPRYRGQPNQQGYVPELRDWMAEAGRALLQVVADGLIEKPNQVEAPWLYFALERNRPREPQSVALRHDAVRPECRFQDDAESIIGTLWTLQWKENSAWLHPPAMNAAERFLYRHIFLEAMNSWLRCRYPDWPWLAPLNALTAWKFERENGEQFELVSDWLTSDGNQRLPSFAFSLANQCIRACELLHDEIARQTYAVGFSGTSWNELKDGQQMIVRRILSNPRWTKLTIEDILFKTAGLSDGKRNRRLLKELYAADIGILEKIGPRKGVRLVKLPRDMPQSVELHESWFQSAKSA